MSGWIGVDLDGTLAEYHGWTGSAQSIGAPIPAMVGRVRWWLQQNIEVRIMTARISHDPDGSVEAEIQNWCLKHLGQN